MIDRLKSKQMKSGMSPAKNSSLSKQEDNSLLSADLNSVSEDVLRKAKSQMNAAFENNRLKPGDPGYVYDKRVSMLCCAQLQLLPLCHIFFWLLSEFIAIRDRSTSLLKRPVSGTMTWKIQRKTATLTSMI